MRHILCNCGHHCHRRFHWVLKFHFNLWLQKTQLWGKILSLHRNSLAIFSFDLKRLIHWHKYAPQIQQLAYLAVFGRIFERAKYGQVGYLWNRVAEAAREHGWHPPKSLDLDENFKPEYTLFCCELRFVAIYALFGDLWAKKVPFWVKTVFLGQEVHY